ncbi:hypothetical protein [Chitinophaga sp. sic0106]|uniref:hypothetical protein n=1 Tax=Chitinophaga sp. sic0106 TaxID=2854785 RepID=UPI002102E77C|nr:hypothetical protein [Chitinophaga sp. sic0106]
MEIKQPMPLPLTAANSRKQPWIYSRNLDGFFILLPPFAALLAIWLFPEAFRPQQGVSVAWWVLLVLFIDVSHVYSTIYRTYFDGGTFRRQSRLFVWVPVLAWIAGVVAYAAGPLVFWRILAYMAVYHFVRQQYGFLRIYSRKEARSRLSRRIDTITIYAATVYPLIYWHLKGPMPFNWFIPDDFFYVAGNSKILDILWGAYLAIMAIYLGKEIGHSIKYQLINIPKQLLVLGTLLSWYFGIIFFKGDLTFTLLNVISHGIPYMALVWAHGRKQYHVGASGNKFLQTVFSNRGILLFLGLIALFAFVEEGLWDGFVWREHTRVFSLFQQLPEVESSVVLMLLVPLLAVPQVTHYVLDGFIWKMKEDRYNWREKTMD